MPLLTKHMSHMTKKKTITSTKHQKIFWLNDNLDFCCSPLDAPQQVDYVSEWLSSYRFRTLESKQVDDVLEIHQHLVIVQMGGFSTMLDSYRNKQKQPLPKQ